MVYKSTHKKTLGLRKTLPQILSTEEIIRSESEAQITIHTLLEGGLTIIQRAATALKEGGSGDWSYGLI